MTIIIVMASKESLIMKIASVADVKTHLSAYLKAAAARPVVVTKNGKPVAVLLQWKTKRSWSVGVGAFAPLPNHHRSRATTI